MGANVTNTVALSPGYLAGTWAQRSDLDGQRSALLPLAVVSAAGGLAGSVLLLTIPAGSFRVAVPYLILLACVLLVAQDRLKVLIAARATRRVPVAATGSGTRAAAPGAATPAPAAAPSAGSSPAPPSTAPPPPTAPPAAGAAPRRPGAAELATAGAASVYGGFFGAGLGIMLLAVLGLFGNETPVRRNALKQAMSLVINTIAALFFATSGRVDWVDAGLVGAAAIAGGTIGGRLVPHVRPQWLRAGVVLLGLAVALRELV